MMRLRAGDARWRELLDRRRRKWRRDQARVLDRARAILDDVRRSGDRAVLRYTAKFDGVTLRADGIRVRPREIAAAAARCDPAGLRAMRLAARRIEAFHRRQIPKGWSMGRQGERLGQRVSPLSRVGIYVPGGRAVYPSTVLMAGIPARLAGVPERVMCTPPGPDGRVSPWVLAAADLAGVTRVYKVGGVQAVGAMAYGTETIRPVDKVVGPGNAYVAAAKRLVFGEVDIDHIAGPSELLVVADDSARPDWVAADLLAQAEHDPDALVGLVAVGSRGKSRRLADRVIEAVREGLRGLERRRIAAGAWRRGGFVIEVSDVETAADVAAAVQPEHLSLVVRNAARWADRFSPAGAVFLGGYSPVAAGDYVAGPNHVLPTGGTARFASPLGVEDFVKRTSVVSLGRDALARIAEAGATFAELEGLDAHAASLRIRFGGRAGTGKKER
ncbi:MAG: histidinol dehydrogenase [Nitrospinota bacterium]